jgi:hypothetical protein
MELFNNKDYLKALMEFITLNENNKTDYILHNDNLHYINECIFNLLKPINYEISYIKNEENLKQLIVWLDTEASNNNSFAQDILGYIYVNILYKTRGNITYLYTGLELLKKSANAGNIYALNNLGDYYKNSTDIDEQKFALKNFNSGIEKNCKFIKIYKIKDLENKITKYEKEEKERQDEKQKMKKEIEQIIETIDASFTEIQE